MAFFEKKKAEVQLPPPRHIAIIMDGNGRWAKNRGLPRTAGHAAGAETFRRIANHCRSLGVEYLTDLRVSVILKYPPVPSSVTSREIS